jgi:hypothetical protein
VVIVKKVLIITYHWPPSGGITVLRCLKFVKYLREFGWEPIVFTAKNPSYQFLDYSNEKDIPEGLEIHKVPIFEPINLFKQLSGRKKNQPLQNITSNSAKKKTIVDTLGMWVRGNFFIPDSRSRWIKPSVKYLNSYLQNNRVDAILTDGPPHTNTVIGLQLSKQFNIPWLADFQDPWTQVDYYNKLYIGKRADRKQRALEQEVFKTAKKITIASPTWKKELESIGAKNVDVIYYGFDEPEFANFQSIESEKFTFFHGGLLGEDRNPTSFLSALNQLLVEYPQLKSKIEIKLAGEVDHAVRESIRMNDLDGLTEYMGMIPRQNVLDEYAKASMLLLPINKAANAKGRIPGKLFEMLRTKKPILVFGPNDGDVKQIVEGKQLGKSFDYSDERFIYSHLKKALLSKEIDNFEPFQTVDEFSNRAITMKIAEYLDGITN